MPDDRWFMINWAIQPCVKNGRLSKNFFRVLECLSKDMKHLFYQVVVYYDRERKWKIEEQNISM